MPRTRSGDPIRRSSFEKGSFESGWFVPVPQADARRLVVAAERYERSSREPGQRAGKIGVTGLELLGLFVRLQRSSPIGRLDPSYLWICSTLKRSVDAVWRAIDKLVAVGLLERVRRVEWREEEDGPVWRQATNAYRICRPRWLTAELPAVMRPVPPAPDYEHARAAATESNVEMARGLDPEAYAATEVDDGALAAALGRLGTAVRSRDSVERKESPRRSLNQETCGVALSGDNIIVAAPKAPDSVSGMARAKPPPFS